MGEGEGVVSLKKKPKIYYVSNLDTKKLQVLHLKNLFFIGRRQFENKVLNKQFFLTQTYHNREEKICVKNSQNQYKSITKQKTINITSASFKEFVLPWSSI